MTALALAGTGGGSVAPDLVLPPGFDRVGEVVRFEQDRIPLPSGEPEWSGDDASSKPAPAGDDPCKGEGATPSPGTDGRGPGLAPVERLGRIGLPGAVAHEGDTPLRLVDVTPCTRCHLRGHVAGDPDRCLYYRGSLGLGGAAAVAMGEAQWHFERSVR